MDKAWWLLLVAGWEEIHTPSSETKCEMFESEFVVSRNLIKMVSGTEVYWEKSVLEKGQLGFYIEIGY